MAISSKSIHASECNIVDVSKTQYRLENGLANRLEVTMPEMIFRYVQPLETWLQYKINL